MDKEISVLKVVSDPIRLRLAALLAVEGELCVCHLVSAVGRPQYAVSRQLGMMRAAGLVEARRQGTWMYYKLAEPSCPLQRCLVDFLAGEFADNPAVRADRQRLNETGCRKN